jgi:hypothetical protein
VSSIIRRLKPVPYNLCRVGFVKFLIFISFVDTLHLVKHKITDFILRDCITIFLRDCYELKWSQRRKTVDTWENPILYRVTQDQYSRNSEVH